MTAVAECIGAILIVGAGGAIAAMRWRGLLLRAVRTFRIRSIRRVLMRTR